VCLALWLGADAARAEDWTSLGLDGTRTRLSSERSGSHFDAGAWRHEWPGDAGPSYRALLASPAVGDGYVTFATQQNLVRTLSEVDGHLIWERRIGGTVFASPVIWRGLVFVFGTNQQLHALRLSDGASVWQQELGGLGFASPLVHDGSLYVATSAPTPRLLRMDARSGQLLWQAGEGALATAAMASVAVVDGHALVVQMEGQVFSFSTADGKLEWMTETQGRVAMASPIVVDGRAYLASIAERARLFALDLATGAVVDGWPLDLPIPAAPERLGAARERQQQVSSVAGTSDNLMITVRADDYFGSNGIGQPDTFFSQELVFAVDGTRREIRWSKDNGTLETKDGNQIPSFELLATPSLHRSGRGELLIAVTSSLQPRLRVFAANGDERWAAPLSAATRSSPVFANGRVVVATDAGVVHSFLSTMNQPPAAPVMGLSPGAGGDSDAARTILRWGAAVDPEGQAVRYQVRVDDDGEILRDWDFEVMTDPDVGSVALAPLTPGATYTFAIRARDSHGALSAWTEPQSFNAVGSPVVSIDGHPVGSLDEALASAPPGAIIRLGVGTFSLSSTLHLPPGVRLEGAGPHLTTLSGKGLAVAVAPAARGELRLLTVAGAQIGVQVDGVSDVHLNNVILRDNADVGLDVTATGAVDLTSATVTRNGVGVRAGGTTRVRNTLIIGNDVGLAAAAAGLLTSRFDNVYRNRSDDYRNVVAADSDLALAVAFDAPDSELRLQAAQPTTDKGDPADDFSAEPLPNGGRINIGAFGNTAFAELSATGEGPDGGSDSDAGATSDGGASQPVAPSGDGCACAIGQSGGPAVPPTGLLVCLGVVLLGFARRRRG
jgi:outer membrane protein assembly factor BamB